MGISLKDIRPLLFYKSKGEGMNPELQHWDRQIWGVTTEAVQSCLPHLIKKDSYNIIDVGANTGVFTQILMSLIPIQRAILFEPIEEYASYCQEKFKLFPQITTKNIGLSDEKEMTSINISTSWNKGWNTMLDMTNEENNKKTQI